MMKKMIPVLTLALMMGVSSNVMAGNMANSDHSAPMAPSMENIPVVTVVSVQTMPEDSKVNVKGNLSKYVNDEIYVFNDGTGEIMVEIDDDILDPATFQPVENVTLIGEVEKEDGNIIIEVDQIMMPNNP